MHSLSKIYGLHSVQAALDYSANKIQKVWYDGQRKDHHLKQIVDIMMGLGIQVVKSERKALERMADGKNHQGIIIEVILPRTQGEEDLKRVLKNLTDKPFFLVLDHVQDPHNLGACLRTADAAGVQGIIVTKDQAVGITPTVCKVACGAAETVPVYQVVNLARTLRWLKSQNLWIIGAAGDAEQEIYQIDLNIPLVVVVGAEGKGMRRLTREQCDLLVKLPMQGQVESLNLSVAAGVLLYEAVRQKIYQ
jgi:23S rRNA (guanosine2251-2'-O)-methyltransferase